MKLADRVAIVTGAARGIGREIALTLVREGAKVTVSDIDIEPLNDVANEIKAAGGQALASKVDVTKSAEINQMVEATLQRFGGIDIWSTMPVEVHGIKPLCFMKQRKRSGIQR